MGFKGLIIVAHVLSRNIAMASLLTHIRLQA